MMWCDTWYDMVWYDMIWYDTLWYDNAHDLLNVGWECLWNISLESPLSNKSFVMFLYVSILVAWHGHISNKMIQNKTIRCFFFSGKLKEISFIVLVDHSVFFRKSVGCYVLYFTFVNWQIVLYINFLETVHIVIYIYSIKVMRKPMIHGGVCQRWIVLPGY